MEVRDKVAVVTGGASGIGKGIARALAAHGAHVMVADVEFSRAQAVATEIAAQGVSTIAHACDVSDRQAVEALAEDAWHEFGHVEILCNNAGVGLASPVERISDKDAQWILAVNFFGVLNGCAVFVPRFKRQGGPAHIVNTGSEHSLGVPFRGLGIYTASKHAVLGLSDVLRREVAQDGIGVSILCPALVRTDVWNAARNRQAQFGGPSQAPTPNADLMSAGMDPDEVGRIAVQGIREGRFFILTHREVRKIAQARADEVLAAFDALDGERR